MNFQQRLRYMIPVDEKDNAFLFVIFMVRLVKKRKLVYSRLSVVFPV
jgi:hypothetical protein